VAHVREGIGQPGLNTRPIASLYSLFHGSPILSLPELTYLIGHSWTSHSRISGTLINRILSVVGLLYLSFSSVVFTSTSLDSPEIFPGGLIGPMGDFLYPSTSTWDKRDARGVASFVGFIIAIWVALGIFISAITFFCQQQRQMRVPPSSSTVSDNSQVLHRESAVSGASQAQSGGSPVNGGSSSHSRFGSMGGKQVSSVGSSGFIGGFQAASIVSPINATSQEPLASPSSAFAVHSPSQPHMAEDRQPVADNVTNPTSLEAGSLPTHTTIDTPNFTTAVSESSRGAPVVPSVPSQLPTLVL